MNWNEGLRRLFKVSSWLVGLCCLVGAGFVINSEIENHLAGVAAQPHCKFVVQNPGFSEVETFRACARVLDEYRGQPEQEYRKQSAMHYAWESVKAAGVALVIFVGYLAFGALVLASLRYVIAGFRS